MKKWIKALTVASVLAAAQSSAMAAEGRAVLADQTLVSAENASLNFRNAPAPVGLVEDLRKGGYVIVFRYTGSGGDDAAIAPEIKQKVIDDGQRISKRSIERMTSYGKKYQDLGIPVNRVLSSEYYFVWQHAQAAFGNPIQISRDLTGSLNFRDKNELAQSLQNLRNRTVTPPDAGQNTILFTHQGKFDKAYGYYIPAGTTILFKPDGTSTPKLVAVLSYDEFMALK